ncbi:MAG: hypothetical protein ABIN24_06110 [Dyadobacter sp.]
MMKKLHFIAQAKGGVGKSLLMYLFALKNHKDPSCLFVDLDSSTHTTKRQLGFVKEENLDSVSLLDEKGLLIRDNLISYLEALAKTDFDHIYFDLGAPESEQLPALMQFDLPLDSFAYLLDFKIIFHVVIGGGGAYNASVDYLIKMEEVTGKKFLINVWQSMATFRKFPHLAQELHENCLNAGLNCYGFGDFEPESYLGSQILAGVRQGIGIDEFTTGPKLRLQRELEINFDHV